MSAIVYDQGEPYVYGKRGIKYTMPVVTSRWNLAPTYSGYPFSRYVLSADGIVLKLFWRVIRTIPLTHIEKVTIWYSDGGAKAEVSMVGSDSTVILSTEHPVKLGLAFEGLHVKLEAIEPSVFESISDEGDV